VDWVKVIDSSVCQTVQAEVKVNLKTQSLGNAEHFGRRKFDVMEV